MVEYEIIFPRIGLIRARSESIGLIGDQPSHSPPPKAISANLPRCRYAFDPETRRAGHQ